MSDMPTLLLVQADPVGVDGTRRWFAEKTLSGIQHFVDDWPGRVVVSAPSSRSRPTAMEVAADVRSVPFDLMLDVTPSDAAHRVDPSVVLALHSPSNYELISWKRHRVVYTMENGLRQRFRVETLQSSSPLSRARISLGLARRAPAFFRALRLAAGLQCNGYAAWEQHWRLSPAPMLFFDHRVSGDVIAESKAVQVSGALALGFSGRHIAIKGPEHALQLHAGLRESGIDAALTMLGDGELRSMLQIGAPRNVALQGSW